MGAHVSKLECQDFYGIKLNCDINPSSNTTAFALGGITPGNFQGDPDIAGIGVLGAFLIVTFFSVALSIGNAIWWILKNVLHWKDRLTHEEKGQKKWQLSVSGFFESLVTTCSDQQIFTGGAYAITLRYSKGCSISAYHYNIVANMLLLTCATHLMAVTIAKHYWEHPYIALLRIGITTLVYIVTGVLLANQTGAGNAFPTAVPSDTDTYSTVLLPAACFQRNDSQFRNSLQQTFSSGSASSFLTGQIHGWTEYLVMFAFYLVAVFVSLGRFVRRGTNHPGTRKRFVDALQRSSLTRFLFRAKRFFYLLFAVYLVGGVGTAVWAVQSAFRYILDLRRWVDQSGWMHKPNVENDPSTFGQLVPLLLMTLTLFTFLHLLSEKLSVRRKRAKMIQDIRDQQFSSGNNGTVTQVNPDNSNLYPGTTGGLMGEKWTGIGIAVSDVDDGLLNKMPRTTATVTTISSRNTSPHLHSQSRGLSTPQEEIQQLGSQQIWRSDHGIQSARPAGPQVRSVSTPATPQPGTYSMFPISTPPPLGSEEIISTAPPSIPRKSQSRERIRRMATDASMVSTLTAVDNQSSASISGSSGGRGGGNLGQGGFVPGLAPGSSW